MSDPDEARRRWRDRYDDSIAEERARLRASLPSVWGCLGELIFEVAAALVVYAIIAASWAVLT